MKLFTLVALCCLLNTVVPAQEVYSLIPYRQDSLWGFCDSAKKVIVKPRYDKVDWFFKFEAGQGRPYQLVSIVTKGNKNGLIDSTGKVLVTCAYDEVLSFYDPNIFDYRKSILLRKGKSFYAYAIQSGKITAVRPTFADTAEQEMVREVMLACDVTDKSVVVEQKDSSTAMVQKREYQSASESYRWDTFYIPTQQIRKIDCSDRLLYSRKAGGWGLITWSGTEIIPSQYDSIFELDRGMYYAVKLKEGWGIMYVNETTPDSLKYKVIAPPGYRDLRAGLSSKGFVINRDGQWGILLFDYAENKGTEYLLGTELYTKYDFYNGGNIAAVYDSHEKFLGYLNLNGTRYWD